MRRVPSEQELRDKGKCLGSMPPNPSSVLLVKLISYFVYQPFSVTRNVGNLLENKVQLVFTEIAVGHNAQCTLVDITALDNDSFPGGFEFCGSHLRNETEWE
jgi:hypothetical protein